MVCFGLAVSSLLIAVVVAFILSKVNEARYSEAWGVIASIELAMIVGLTIYALHLFTRQNINYDEFWMVVHLTIWYLFAGFVLQPSMIRYLRKRH